MGKRQVQENQVLVQTLSTETSSVRFYCKCFAYCSGFYSCPAPTSATSIKPKPDRNTQNDNSNGNEDEYSRVGNQREPQSNAHFAANAFKESNLKETHDKVTRFNKTITRSNNLVEALSLATLCNMNPRSVYNKVEEFHEFVKNEDVDIVFMSESWERENKTLLEIVKLEDHEVISNVHQRKGKGGRPAIIVNTKKYDVKTLTNTLIPVKWGVEAVWALVTPKNVSQTS